MSVNALANELSQFLQSSPTPFHAVSTMKTSLLEAGFKHLDEADQWQLNADGRYFVTRNDSSLIAFQLNTNSKPSESGFRIVGAHTDSPCLKLKPQPNLYKHGYMQVGVEVYGGALLNPWFDRDLSIAGRVSYLDKEDQINSVLINFKDPVAVIPSLAIHLDREVNTNRSINAQTHLPPVLLQYGESQDKPDFRELLVAQIKAEHNIVVSKVLDFELSLFDVNPPSMVGLKQEFFAGARLDNLLSCFAGVRGLLDCKGDRNTMLVCSDHEEVGSVSAAGANGPFLEAVLERIIENRESNSANGAELFRRAMNKSILLSVDNAHGIHPNYADRHDQQHGPLLNKGPVIKVNANQRYATNSNTSSFFRQLCDSCKVPVQSFVVRSDMGCGSTIGPVVSAELGVDTLDVGVPTFAMHSIRELAGTADIKYLGKVITAYFSS